MCFISNKIWLPKKVEKAEMFEFEKHPPGFSQFTLRQKAKPFYEKTFKRSSKFIFNALFVLWS